MADPHVETMRRPNFAPFNLIGQHGNQCALITEPPTPCQEEIGGLWWTGSVGRTRSPALT
jgi:hypothetical protein